MKKALLLSLTTISIMASMSQAGELGDYSFSTDFVAPIVQSRANLSDAVAGTIVYDTTASAFYGLPVGGNPTSATAWAQLSITPGYNAVVSAGNERVERARVTCGNSGSTTAATSSAWLTANNGASTGLCSVTITGTFSAEPVCQCTVIGGPGGSNNNCLITAAATTTTVSFQRVRNNAVENGDIYLTCVGPR